MLCRNCTSAWYPVREKLKKIKFGKLPTDDSNATYLPFWCIRPKISGLNLESYSDLIQVANLPKVVRPGWEKVGFQFWVPAFKVRPKVFLRLSTNLTLSQLHAQPDEDLPEQRHHSVTLPLTEAIESLKVNLASFLKPKTQLAEILPGVDISAKSAVLVYIPFSEKHHELIQPDIPFAINKNILSLSKNL